MSQNIFYTATNKHAHPHLNGDFGRHDVLQLLDDKRAELSPLTAQHPRLQYVPSVTIELKLCIVKLHG